MDEEELCFHTDYGLSYPNYGWAGHNAKKSVADALQSISFGMKYRLDFRKFPGSPVFFTQVFIGFRVVETLSVPGQFLSRPVGDVA